MSVKENLNIITLLDCPRIINKKVQPSDALVDFDKCSNYIFIYGARVTENDDGSNMDEKKTAYMPVWQNFFEHLNK